MKTVTITTNEIIAKQVIAFLEQFPKEQYSMKVTERSRSGNTRRPLSIKRGAGKHLITYISENFDEPLDDFAEFWTRKRDSSS